MFCHSLLLFLLVPPASSAPQQPAAGSTGSAIKPPVASKPSSESTSQAAAAASTLSSSKANGNELKSVVIEANRSDHLKTSLVTASVEPSPKNNGEEKQPLILERPKRISFSKVEEVDPPGVTKLDITPTSGGKTSNGPQLRMQSSPLTTLEVSREPSNSLSTAKASKGRTASSSGGPLSNSSPGTPCSECLREGNGMTDVNGPSKLPHADHNGGQEFFGSSEECCSSWSGCCNSSCEAGSCADQTIQQGKQSSSQPLSAYVVMQQHQESESAAGAGTKVKSSTLCNNKLSVSTGGDLANTRTVATISCPQFESNRLSKISRSVPEDLPACEMDATNQRHLVTFVTPSMETIPLEMCQDIPDVLI